jgi:HEAT repeat protein
VTYEWIFALGAGVSVIPVKYKEVMEHPRLATLTHLNFRERHRPWDQLIDALKQAKSEQPRSVTKRIDDMPPIVRKARDALQSLSEKQRKTALNNLMDMQHPAAIEVLAEAVDHPAQSVAIQAALYLVSKTSGKDPRAVPGLLNGLNSQHQETRLGCLYALSKVETYEIEEVLLELIHDRNSSISKPALYLLGKRGSAKAIPIMMQLVTKTNDPFEIVEAIAGIGGSEAVPALISMLKGANSYLQQSIIMGLLQIHSPEALAALNPVLEMHAQFINTFELQQWANRVGKGELLEKLLANIAIDRTEPEINRTPLGTPPIIPLSVVQDRWDDVLKAVFQRSSSAPAIMEQFQVAKIDGNTVILETKTELYFRRLNDPLKIKIVEAALKQVFKIPLRVMLRVSPIVEE